MDSMNQTTNTPQGGSAPMGGMPLGEDKKNNEGGRGALIGTIIIIVLLIVGGVYAWNARVPGTSDLDQEVLNAPDTSLDSLKTQDSSDDINAIDQDVNNTDLNSLNSEVQNIDNELNSVQ